MVEIRENEKPSVSDVEKIEIEIDTLPLDAAGIVEPRTLHEGRFSIYFLAGLALAEGKVTIENLIQEKILSPELVDLRKKVKATGHSGVGLSSHVKVYLKDGKIIEEYTSAPKGSVEKPLTPGELQEKFRTTCGLPPERAKAVIGKVMGLEKVGCMDEILSLI
ncbi:MAG: MmgE/PrpD family protein [Desulfosarcina sp.]|nr:MmgE/PrpD family protein [Desulfobacterales bacterium]